MCTRRRLLSFINSSTNKKILRATSSRPKFLPIDDKTLGLTPDESDLRNLAHKFFKEKIDPLAYEIDKNDDFPGFRSFMKECGDMGFNSTVIPEKYGGLAVDGSNGYLNSCIIGEELSRISAGVGLSYGAHNWLCMHQILKNGSEQQIQKYVPELMAGNAIGALAMSEPDAGSDVVNMKCTAKKVGSDQYILNGNKMWITNGPMADIYVIYAKVDGKDRKATAFIIDRREHPDTFKVGQKLDKLGIRGSQTGELIFENCVVNESNILGKEGYGFYVLMSGLNIERITLAAATVGIMQACNDVAFTYANDRQQFGRPISENQLIQGKMADMYARCNSARAYTYMLARAADMNNYNNKDCAAVALMAAENATQSALDCIQILGGNGYINDYPAGRFLRDAKLFEIGGGTTEIRRWLIGREINLEVRR